MNLAFLTPALLAGLAAVAVPIIIHLISKRRARRVQFALLELLLKSQKKTARSIRLRQLLLLIVRTLLIAALALAVAQPFLDEQASARTTTAPLVVVAVLDGSASMQATDGARTLFERARRDALASLRDLPADVRVGALACGSEKDGAALELSAPTFERARVMAVLEQAAAGVLSSSLPACVDRATAMARAVAGQGERRVLVFSDLAAHAFAGGRAGENGAGVLVEWRRATTATVQNRALLDASVERVATRTGAALAVPFQAASYGGAAEVEADLLIGASRAARVTLPLPDGRPLDRKFHAALDPAPEAPPASEIAVSLPDDALSLDNRIALPVDAAGALDVLVVDGAPQALRFQDEVFYLESALDAVRGGRARVRFSTVGAEHVTRAQIAGARVVVLANVGRLDDDVAAALVEHTQAGAGVLVSMGDQIDVEWMNAKLLPLLPAPLRGSKGQALLDDASVAEVLSLTRFRAEHPIFGSLSAAGAEALDVPGLARVRTHTLMLVEPSVDKDAIVLARFSNGAPALVERAAGSGRVLTLLTSIDRDWTDLAIRPGYVPLMQQAVLYLGGALEDAGPRTIRAGAVRTLRVPTGAVELVVQKPSGEKVPLAVASDARTLEFKNTDEVGLYGVWSRGDGGELRERLGERFSVLVDARESDLRAASPDALASAVPQGARARTHEDAEQGVKLWPYLLLAAALLLLVEAAVLKKTFA